MNILRLAHQFCYSTKAVQPPTLLQIAETSKNLLAKNLSRTFLNIQKDKGRELANTAAVPISNIGHICSINKSTRAPIQIQGFFNTDYPKISHLMKEILASEQSSDPIILDMVHIPPAEGFEDKLLRKCSTVDLVDGLAAERIWCMVPYGSGRERKVENWTTEIAGSNPKYWSYWVEKMPDIKQNSPTRHYPALSEVLPGSGSQDKIASVILVAYYNTPSDSVIESASFMKLQQEAGPDDICKLIEAGAKKGTRYFQLEGVFINSQDIIGVFQFCSLQGYKIFHKSTDTSLVKGYPAEQIQIVVDFAPE